MLTVATQPSLEITQAVGAVLLDQFARERFSEAGVDENLIREAEDREHLDALVSTLLDQDEQNGPNNSCSYNLLNNTSNNLVVDRSATGDGDETCNMSNQNTVYNTTARSDDGPSELFHSVAESSLNGTPQRSDRTQYHSMNAVECPFDRIRDSACFASLGAELRRIADEFNNSPERVRVREIAEKTALQDITKDKFMDLLEGLFSEKIDRAGIVALFFFCTDVALKAAHFARELVVNLLGWSFSYIIQRVCNLVHRLGGWDKVLPQSISDFLINQAPNIVSLGCALLAFWLGIKIRRIFT